MEAASDGETGLAHPHSWYSPRQVLDDTFCFSGDDLSPMEKGRCEGRRCKNHRGETPWQSISPPS